MTHGHSWVDSRDAIASKNIKMFETLLKFIVSWVDASLDFNETVLLHLQVSDGRNVQRMIVKVAKMGDTDPVTCLSQNGPI